MTEALLPFDWPGTYFLGEEEIDAVSKVILARSPFRYYGHDVQGYVDQIEAAYRERVGRKYALAVNSGTAALNVAMSAFDIGPGDEVLVPGYLWVSCVASVVRAGAIPRLVDIDETLCMDPDDLVHKITPHSKAVIVVHMNGAAGHLARLLEVSRAHGLLVLEDVAQANGGSYKGKPLGSFGDAAIFSFQLNKNMTSGEGGMFVTGDVARYQRAWAAHDMGYARNDQGIVDMEDETVQLWGQGCRMSELTAAVAVMQERKLDTIVEKMRARSRQLYEGLDAIEGIETRRVTDPDGDSGPIVGLLWPDTGTRDKMIEATRAAGVRNARGGGHAPLSGWGLHLYYNNLSLVNKRGVNSAGRPWTDPANAFAASYRYDKGTLPQAEDLFARASLLAVPPTLTESACEQIIDIFQAAWSGLKP